MDPVEQIATKIQELYDQIGADVMIIPDQIQEMLEEGMTEEEILAKTKASIALQRNRDMETMEEQAVRIAMEVMEIHSQQGAESIVDPKGILEDLQEGMTEKEILEQAKIDGAKMASI